MSKIIRISRMLTTSLIVLFCIAGLQAAEPQWMPAKTPDGQPDIQGFWQNAGINPISIVGETPNIGLGRKNSSLVGEDHPDFGVAEGAGAAASGAPPPWGPDAESIIVDPEDGSLPLQPWAMKQYLYNRENFNEPGGDLTKIDSMTRCLPSGVPRIMYATPYNGLQIIQPPGYVVIYQEFNHQYRIIPLDGRPHIGAGFKLWNGDSRGRWEGNTLIIETTNLNGKAWFDMSGTFDTDATRVTERLTFLRQDAIELLVTIDDPNAYTRPWTFKFALGRITESGYELLEFACHEGNRALELIIDR